MGIQITGDASSYDKAIDDMLAATAKAVDSIDAFEASMQKLNFDQAESEIKGFAGVVASSKKELSSITGEYSKINTRTKNVVTGLETYTEKMRDVNKNIKTALRESTTGFGKISTKLETATSNVKSFSSAIRGITTRTGTLSTKLSEASANAGTFAKSLNDALKNNDVFRSLSKLTYTINRFTTEIYKSVDGLAAFNKAKGMLDLSKNVTGLKNLEKNIKGANKQIKIMGVNMTALMHMAFYRIFVRLTQYVRQSISTVLEFNKALIEIQSVSSGGFNIGTLESDLRSLAQTSGTVKGEVTDALYQILSLQYSDTTTAISDLNSMISASVTLNTKLTDVVEITAMAFNNYGTAIGTTDNIMAIFNRTIQLGKVRLSEMTNIMGQVLPIASNMGVGLESVSAMMDTFTIKGMSAAKAGTQIRGLFLSLIKPTKALSDAYEQLGLTSGKQGVALFGLSGFLKKINEHYKGNISLLSKAIGRQRAFNAFISLSKDGFKEFDNAIKETNESMEDYLKVKKDPSESMANKFEAAMQRMKNAFESEFTQPFIKAMISLNEKFGPIISSAMKLIKYLMLIGGVVYTWVKLGKVIDVINSKYGETLKLNKTMITLKKDLAVLRKKEIIQNKIALNRATTTVKIASAGVTIMKNKAVTAISTIGVAANAMIETIGSALKAMATQTVILAVFMAIGYAIEKVIEYYSSLQDSVEKANEAIKRSTESVIEKISMMIEVNKGISRGKEEKVIDKYRQIRNAAQELYVWSLKGSLNLEDFIKRTDKVIASASKGVVKYFNEAVKASDKTLNKLTKDINTLNKEAEKQAITLKDRLDTFFGGITYEIDIITGKRSLKKAKDDVSKLQEEIIKANKEAEDKIKKERNKKVVDQDKITNIRSDLTEKVQGYNEQIKKLQENIAKSNLFFNKKVPALYQGLNLKETEDYLNKIKAELVDSFKTVIEGRDTSDISNKGLEKQKQLINDLTVLKQKLATAGMSTKNIDITIAQNKEAYRKMIQQAKDAKEKLKKIEEEKNAELKKNEKEYNKAFKEKDIGALKDLSSKKNLPDKVKEQIDIVITNMEAQKTAQDNWNKLQDINKMQLDELKAIREELADKNEKLAAKKDQAIAMSNAKQTINKAKEKFNEKYDFGISEISIKNSKYIGGEKNAAVDRILQEMLVNGNAGMIKPLTQSTEMMKMAIDHLTSMRRGREAIDDKGAVEAINMLSKSLTELYNANKKAGDIVETPRRFEKTKKNEKGEDTVAFTLKDERKAEIKINLDGRTIARQLMDVFSNTPELTLNA